MGIIFTSPWNIVRGECYPHPVMETEARSICGQLLEALQVLHEAGIVHRDIKPKVYNVSRMSSSEE